MSTPSDKVFPVASAASSSPLFKIVSSDANSLVLQAGNDQITLKKSLEEDDDYGSLVGEVGADVTIKLGSKEAFTGCYNKLQEFFNEYAKLNANHHQYNYYHPRFEQYCRIDQNQMVKILGSTSSKASHDPKLMAFRNLITSFAAHLKTQGLVDEETKNSLCSFFYFSEPAPAASKKAKP